MKMFTRSQATEEDLFRWKDHVNHARDVLRDTFGEQSSHIRRFDETIEEMVAEDKDWNWQISSMYASWALAYPEKLVEVVTSPCKCENGWVYEGEGPTRAVRPCMRCNSQAFEALYGEGVKSYTPGGYQEPPPPEPMGFDDDY